MSVGFLVTKSTWLLWREISWLKHLSKDRCVRRRCSYEMNASLAMHSRAHQDFLKETSILGMCIGERKEKLTNGRKLWRQTVHGCTRTRHFSLSLPLYQLSFSFSLLFIPFLSRTAVEYILLSQLHSLILNIYACVLINMHTHIRTDIHI